MEWTDIRITVPKARAEEAEAIATGISGGGIYIEDYSDLETQVEAIAHVDLIEQDLLDKPRDQVIVHMYLAPDEPPAEVLALLKDRLDSCEMPYTLNTEGLSLDRPVENGELINVYYETVMETYPARFGGVTAVEHTQTERDDRCGLYLQVLEDLWETDPGLNTGLEELAVDFSGLTDLTESEKAALAWEFGNAHGLTPITGTWEELVEAGYIDGENLVWNGSGCLFTLTGSAEEGFQAEKWASGLGAYFFTDCTARRSADGTWTYQVGGHAIA